MDSNQNEATIKKSIEIGAAVTKNETDLPTNDDKVKKMEKKIADQNKEIYKLTEENAQLKEELGKIGNQRQQNNCPSNLADAFENGVSINKDDSDEEEWDSCRESVGNKIVQDCAKQAIRQYNAEQVDQPNYFFIIKVLSSHSAFCIGYMHYVEILIGKSSISKKQATQQEFEEMSSSKNILENEDKVEKTIMAICCDCDEREIAQDHPARTIQISEI